MFIKEEFPDDNNIAVMDIQTEYYFNVIKSLLNFCKEKYIFACDLLDNINNNYYFLNDNNGFYETTFEPVIEFFSAYYRYKYCKNQLTLFKNDDEISLTTSWLEYIEKESIRLSNDPIFCRLMIDAFCNQKNFRAIDYSHDEFHIDIKAIIIKMQEIYFDFPKGEFRFEKMNLK